MVFLKRSRLVAVLVAVSCAVPATGGAQEAGAPELLQRGLALAASGDTASAIDVLQQATKTDKKLAEAYLELGRLYMHRAGWREGDLVDRRKAEKALERAYDLDPGNPRVLAALGYLRVKQNLKHDGGRILRQAIEKAEEQGFDDSEVLAEAHYYLGYVNEREYDRMRDRVFIPPSRGEIGTTTEAAPHTMIVSRAVDEYLRATSPIEGIGGSHKALMLDNYRAAIRYDRSHFEAHRRLMLHLLDDGLLTEYIVFARNLLETNPDRAEAHLYLGLGLHALGEEDEAAASFERGLAMFSEDERWAFLNIEPTLRKDPGQVYLDLAPAERARIEDEYWNISDPLYLTAANERRLEHRARVAYADLRFSEPSTGKRGWDTDRGLIYIRYGPPLGVARAGAIVWRYGADGPVFMFNQQPGYNRTLFAGDYRFIAQDYRAIEPANYDRIPSIPELLDLPVQLARFRGATTTELALEVHAQIPLERLSSSAELSSGEIEQGLFLLNARGDRVAEQKQTEVVSFEDAERRHGLRSWRLLLPSGGLLVAAVEARESSSWIAAASRDTFSATPFHNTGVPQISDLLLADAIRPLMKEPTERGHYDIMGNAALRYGPGDPLALYWEIYDLEQDRLGFASYDVSVEVRIEKLHREGVIPSILGGLADLWGFTVEGDDHIELRFHREVDMKTRDRVTEHLRLELKGAPSGEYEIRIRVWDRLSEQMTSRSRKLTVGE